MTIHSPILRRSDAAISGRHVQDRHRRAARILGCALAADSGATLVTCALLWAHHLSTVERAAVAMAMLRTMTPDAQTMVTKAAMHGGAE